MLKLLEYPAVVYTIGSMGSGKTTLALATYVYLHDKMLSSIDLHYINVDSEDQLLDAFNETVNRIRESSTEYHFILLDDLSYVLNPRSSKGKEFLTRVFKIRHLAGKDNIIIWLNGHYSRSIAPFLRATNYRILTSLTQPEIRQYTSEYLFSEADLWEYLRALNRMKHVILAQFKHVSKLISVNLTPKNYKLIRRIAEVKKEYGID
jgi:chromosomal replication initiation ATPase DnaA